MINNDHGGTKRIIEDFRSVSSDVAKSTVEQNKKSRANLKNNKTSKMVRMDTIEKERFRYQCPQLWSQEDCRYQTVEVKKRLQGLPLTVDV